MAHLLRCCMALFALVVASASLGTTSTAPVADAWNEDASSKLLSAERLSSLGEAFPAWRARQVTWPSKAEIQKHRVEANDKEKNDCVKVIGQVLKPEYVPAGLKDHLVAMNDWGIVGDPGSSDLRADVFVVRYRTGKCVIHIQQGVSSAFVAVADEELAAKAEDDPEQYVREVCSKYINPERLPGTLVAANGIGTAVMGFRVDRDRHFAMADGPPDIRKVITDKHFVLFHGKRLRMHPDINDLTPRF